MILFKANPSVWPTDPKQRLALLEIVAKGAENLLKSKQLGEIGWFNNTEGYALLEDTKEKAIEISAPFFEYYNKEVHEVVPHEKAADALLRSARMSAGSA